MQYMHATDPKIALLKRPILTDGHTSDKLTSLLTTAKKS